MYDIWSHSATATAKSSASGSRKTLAYGLPLIMNDPQKQSYGINGMVLTPTQELAIQIGNKFSTVTIVILNEVDFLAIHPDMAKKVDALLELCGTAYRPRIRMGLFLATTPRKVNDQWEQWTSTPRAILKMIPYNEHNSNCKLEIVPSNNNNENSCIHLTLIATKNIAKFDRSGRRHPKR